MATTTNYGWDTPDDTDLVKDGAAAIRTLGSSIDTTTKNLNPETTTGDISYRSATANTNTRLAIGSTGQVLTVAAGVPSWATPTDQTPLTTKGDVFTFSTVDARLGVGANGTVLTADSAETTGLKWAAPSGASFVGASAYRSTTLSLTADTVVIVTYANESYDTSAFHSTSADTSRMTVPSGKAGKYLCIANMFATGGSSRMIIYPYKNGSNVGGSPNWSYVFDNRGYGNAGAMTGSWVMDLAVADYVEVGLYSVTNTATLQESTFQFIYLGA